MKNKVMITMVRDNGNSYGFTYILSKEDADFVEREIKGLYRYCESVCTKEEKECVE